MVIYSPSSAKLTLPTTATTMYLVLAVNDLKIYIVIILTLSPHHNFLSTFHQPSNQGFIDYPIHDIVAICIFVLDLQILSCENVCELARFFSQICGWLVDNELRNAVINSSYLYINL